MDFEAMEQTPEGTVFFVKWLGKPPLFALNPQLGSKAAVLQRDALNETSKTAVDLVGDDPKSTN